ncbi:hypothetical protein [Campylobacter volucris]|uniref:hypothetical protein n=1 Tax=Campylobacter volucris TaxID=1031542 RepID=UPI001FB78257|nr:hypothetical protein [Campylobacter volucris]
MTCYLHIGTEKTGTTSIQNFLLQNYDLLLSYGKYYSKRLLKYNVHLWIVELVTDFYMQNIIDESAIKLQILNSKKYEILLNEIALYRNKDFIFSCEIICRDFFHEKHIIILKNILKILGFNNIFIVLYVREISSFLQSYTSQNIKGGAYFNSGEMMFNEHPSIHSFDVLKIIKIYIKYFKKENLIIRLFDKNEFYQGDLFKDFLYVLNIEWSDKFIIPKKLNESLNLIGIEILKRINNLHSHSFNIKLPHNAIHGNVLRNECGHFISKHFCIIQPKLEFKCSKKVLQSYIDYFEESYKWIRKEFFPYKKRLFYKNDLTNYRENYELKEMKSEYWDRIAELIADIVKTKSTQMQNLQTNLDKIIKEKDNIINSKLIQLNQIQSKLSFQTKYGTAKSRIQNQLSYKLGQAMMINSKSLLGYIKMPFVLSYIKDKHKQEQKIYQEKVKKDPSLKLPPLEDYPDYKEALKEKECLTYKLGQALIQANKTWYGGGYIKLLFEIMKLKKEFKNK